MRGKIDEISKCGWLTFVIVCSFVFRHDFSILPAPPICSFLLYRMNLAQRYEARDFEKAGVNVPVRTKLQLSAWQPFIFANDRASRRRFSLQLLPGFLLFLCTLEVFAALGGVLHSPPGGCDPVSASILPSPAALLETFSWSPKK